MANKMTWTAKDKKNGMSLEELERALDMLKQTRPGARWKLRATVGWGWQIEAISFEEVEDAHPATA